MGWIEQLYDHTVALDTPPLIAFIAKEDPYFEIVRPLFQAIDQGKIRAVTSMVTFIEVLVHPLREKKCGTGKAIQRYFDARQVCNHLFA